MALERNPNSKNLFYVDPKLFPIQGTNCTIDIEESTGKFTFDGLQRGSYFELVAEFEEPLNAGSYTFWMQYGLNEPINTAALYYNYQSSIRSINYNGFDKLIEWGSDTAGGYNFTVSYGTRVTQLRLTFNAYSAMLPQYSGPQGIALTRASESFNEWESAYLNTKVDLDPIFSSKLITVGQLSRLTGSGTASGAQANKLVTMGQLARLTGKQAHDEGKLVTVGQANRAI